MVLWNILLSIHILCDGWTTPNTLGIFRIVRHFIDEKRRLQALLLALIEIEGKHTEEQLAVNMFTVLDQFTIKNRLGYFVIDNDTSNDCMVTSISDQFFESDKLNYDSQQYWLRYNSHIINLSVQAFLFQLLPKDIILGGRSGGRKKNPTTTNLQRLSKMSPVGKLYNIVVYIKASPKRT